MRLPFRAMLALPALMAATPALADTVTSPAGAGGAFVKYVQVAQTVNIAQTGVISKVSVRIPGYSDNQTTNGYGIQIVLKHGATSVILLDTGTCATYNGIMTIRDDSGTPYSYFKNCVYNATIDFRPSQPLSAFNGQQVSGDWTLVVYDKQADGGKFGAWTVTVTYDTPTWTPGQWSAYSTTCGTATRTRGMSCTLAGATVADSQCTGTKPDTTETTSQTSGCGYSWQTGDWTPVHAANSTCGATTETTTLTCLRSDGQTVADASCSAVAKPASTRPYTDPVQCSYAWETGVWNEPSGTCGDGTRTRTVRCISVTDPAFPQLESQCAANPKPSTSEAVSNYSSCLYGWYRSGFEIGSCVNGRQTYRAYFSCYRSTGTPVTNYCGDKPPTRVTTQSCGYWAEHIGDDFGETAPGVTIPVPNYSTSGTSTGSGYVSKGSDGSSGAVGYKTPVTSSTPVVRTGGSYDAATDTYTVGGAHYTGGLYDTATGTYQGGTASGTDAPGGSTPPADGTTPDEGPTVVMRRPLPTR